VCAGRGEKHTDIWYYISSLPLDVSLFAKLELGVPGASPWRKIDLVCTDLQDFLTLSQFQKLGTVPHGRPQPTHPAKQ
jgi:hypothetical protein